MDLSYIHNFGLTTFLYYSFLIISLLSLFLLRQKIRFSIRLIYLLIYGLLLPSNIYYLLTSRTIILGFSYLSLILLPSIIILRKESHWLSHYLASILFLVFLGDSFITISYQTLPLSRIFYLISLFGSINLASLLYYKMASVKKASIYKSLIFNSYLLFISLLVNIILQNTNLSFFYFKGFTKYNDWQVIPLWLCYGFYFGILNLVLFDLLLVKTNPTIRKSIITFLKKHYYLIFTLIYLIMNTIINSLLFTNNYIGTYDGLYLSRGISFNSWLSDFLFLALILVLVNLITKKKLIQVIILTGITFAFNCLNVAHIGTAAGSQMPLTYTLLFLSKEPKTALNNSISLMALRDFFYYRHYLLLTPTLLLVVSICLFYHMKTPAISNKKTFKKYHYNVQLNLKLFSLTLLALFFTMSQFVGLAYTKHHFPTDSLQYKAVLQTNGVYGFYLHFPHFKSSVKSNYSLANNDVILKRYAKNNSFYQNEYGQTIHKDELRFNGDNFTYVQELKGYFQNKNIVFLQLESFANYLLLNDPNNVLFEYRRELLPDVYDLIDEGYLFEHFHADEGMGHSADGAYSTLMGLPNHGLLSIPYVFTKGKTNLRGSLPHLLNERNYETTLLELTTPYYYNYHNIVPHLYGFNNWVYYEEKTTLKDIANTKMVNIMNTPTFKKYPLYPTKENPVSLLYNEKVDGLSDLFLLEYVTKEFSLRLKTLTNDKQPQFINLVTMLPHAPNIQLQPYHIPFGRYQNKVIKPDIINKLGYMKNEDYWYLQYIGYINAYFKYIKKMIMAFDNTVFIFYGDHTLPNFNLSSLNNLFKTTLNRFQKRQKIREVFAMVYVPDDNHYNNYGLKKGLIKGTQPLLRSQIDLYSTLVDMLSLSSSRAYYGINLFSQEKKMTYDARHGYLFGDNFILGPEFREQHLLPSFVYNPCNYNLLKLLEYRNNMVTFKHALDRLMVVNDFNALTLPNAPQE